MEIMILGVVVVAVAFLMTMTGRGGGNFYVLALVLAGYGMSLSAATGQFILMCSSLAAAILFSRRRMNNWKLTILLGGMIFISALCGGYLGDQFDEGVLKVVFAVFMFFAALLMLRKPRKKLSGDHPYVLVLNTAEGRFHVNLLITVPVVLVTGFVAGMVGVSGGSFLVPLMLLTMGVPMHIAVGTSTILVSVSAAAGFFGHLGAGFFDYRLAIPLALAGVVGGTLGAKVTLETPPRSLKYLFAGTQFVAAVIIVVTIAFGTG